MKVIHAQEQALVFEKFMNEDAYQIGTKIKQGAEKLGHDVVDSISLGDEQLFYYAIQSIAPSTSADLAERSAQPTCSGRVRIWSAWRWQPAAIWFADSGLEPAKFAGVGGCFPINLKGRGFIGAIAVSGMEQQEDHWLVVDTISQYLGVAVESVLPLFK